MDTVTTARNTGVQAEAPRPELPPSKTISNIGSTGHMLQEYSATRRSSYGRDVDRDRRLSRTRSGIAALGMLGCFVCGAGCASPAADEPVVEPSQDVTLARVPKFHRILHAAPAKNASLLEFSGNGIDYHGGPVLLGTTNIYYIWYGNWTSNNATTILTDFANTIGGSPYFGINTTYFNGTGTPISNSVHFAGAVFDGYSRGTNLGDADVQSIVARAISLGQLPSDPNGVYFVLTSPDVNEISGFCTAYCGWHTSGIINGRDIKYSFVGNGNRCPAACQAQFIGPNDNAGADGMASVLAHELEETITDPDLNAWFDSTGEENADKCAWTFGAEYTAANGAAANVRLGGRDFLIQRNWLNTNGGSCALSFIPNILQSQRWATRQGGFWDTQQWLVGDFNGDGKADLANVFSDDGLASIDVHLSNGSGFGSQRWATQQGGFWDTQKWVAGDFNGDGKTDLANVFNDGGSASIDVHLSSGSGFGHQRWATQQGGFWDAQKWVPGDFNGDGRADLANVFDDGGAASMDVHLSSGASFGSQRWATQQGGFWDAQKWVAGDFNGDGRTDLANVFDDGGLASIDVHLSAGANFWSQRWVTKQGGFWDAQKWSAGDFNGDGRSDLANVFNDGGLASIDVHLSSGASFGHQRWATQQGGFWDTQKWVAGDATGDSWADLVNVFNDSDLASIDVHR